MKKLIIVLVLAVVGVGIYFLTKSPAQEVVKTQPDTTQPKTTQTDKVAVVKPTPAENLDETVIGKSVQGRNITAFHYGTGSAEILFVAGIHGGYEWNTVLLAYQIMDYLKTNPSAVPAGLKVTVIPVLNPDGLNKTVGKAGVFTASDVPTSQDVLIAGRFNARNVDLNRNFDCDWKATGVWQNKKVSGGETQFSEPESRAIKNYVEENKITAVVAWYSSAGGVYASSCHNGVSVSTNAIMKTFSDASKYPANADFNFYEITGDMVNWFAKQNIPAISVLLTNHTDTEWTKNLAGITALLNYYGKKVLPR